MDRRNFLRLGSTGLVASATMSEIGMWAEFMSWLQRKPAWSFPSPSPNPWDELNAVTREYIRNSGMIEAMFVNDNPLYLGISRESL